MHKKEQITELMKCLELGLNKSDACAIARVSRDWFYDQLKANPEFAANVERSEIACKQRNIAIIQKAAVKSWQAAAWWLERQYKNEFALKNEITHSGEIKFVTTDYNGNKNPAPIPPGIPPIPTGNITKPGTV